MFRQEKIIKNLSRYSFFFFEDDNLLGWQNYLSNGANSKIIFSTIDDLYRRIISLKHPVYLWVSAQSNYRMSSFEKISYVSFLIASYDINWNKTNSKNNLAA